MSQKIKLTLLFCKYLPCQSTWFLAFEIASFFSASLSTNAHGEAQTSFYNSKIRIPTVGGRPNISNSESHIVLLYARGGFQCACFPVLVCGNEQEL